MKSVMSHNFSTVEGPSLNRSVFKRDHSLITTLDAGYLVPFFWDEALPGDTLSFGQCFWPDDHSHFTGF